MNITELCIYVLLTDTFILPVWGYCDYCCCEHSFIRLLVCIVHIYVGYVPWSIIVGHSVCICSIWVKKGKLFQGDFFISWHSVSSMSDTIAPYPCQHLIFCFSGGPRVLIVIFIFISLISHVIEYLLMYLPFDVLFCDMPVQMSYLFFWIIWQCFLKLLIWV